MLTRYNLTVIGTVRSPYRQRFGIPRQPGLAPSAEGWIEMLPSFDRPEMFDGLSDFSHIWVTFLFHAVIDQGWRPRVRPPRLGGNTTRGVFASRSPFRPNHLGLSVLELLDVDLSHGARLRVRGLDIVDDTPVFDIKPYLPYADSLPAARGGYADQAPARRLDVKFSPAALDAVGKLQIDDALLTLIAASLALDPRPAYRATRDEERVYGLQLIDFDVRFRVRNDTAEVVQIVAVAAGAQ